MALPIAVATTLGRGSQVNDGPIVDYIKARFEAEKAAAIAHESGQKSNAVKRSVAAPIQGQLSKTTLDWPIAAQISMQEYASTLVRGGADAEAKAAQIAEQIKTELTVTASPVIDTSQLERALGLARQLAAALRGEYSGVAVSAAPSVGAVGHPRVRGGPVKAGVTYPVGGKGVELFTPGADGFVTPNSHLGAGASADRPGVAGGITVHAPISLTIYGNGSDEIVRAATKAAQTVTRELTATLDRQLNRAAQTTFSGISYGDA